MNQNGCRGGFLLIETEMQFLRKDDRVCRDEWGFIYTPE